MKEQLDKIIEMPYEQRQLAHDLLRIIVRNNRPVSMGELSRARRYRFYMISHNQGLLTVNVMDCNPFALSAPFGVEWIIIHAEEI